MGGSGKDAPQNSYLKDILDRECGINPHGDDIADRFKESESSGGIGPADQSRGDIADELQLLIDQLQNPELSALFKECRQQVRENDGKETDVENPEALIIEIGVRAPHEIDDLKLHIEKDEVQVDSPSEGEDERLQDGVKDPSSEQEKGCVLLAESSQEKHDPQINRHENGYDDKQSFHRIGLVGLL